MTFKIPMHKDTVPFLLGAAAGAVVITWAGFDAMGWKTANASEALIKRQSEVAVVSAYAQICTVRFKDAKDFGGRLADLQKVDQWSRGDIVAKSGFATMAGEKEPTSGVAQACADLLLPAKT